MTGDPTRDAEHTPRDFGSVPDENDYTAARAQPPALVYCRHMDMDIYEGTCAMCTPPEPQRVIGDVMTRMPAQYETGCDACERRIKPGEDIALVDGVWVHDEHTEQP